MKQCMEGMEEQQCGTETQSLKLGIWNSLLQQRIILLNGEIDDSIIEKAVMQIILMNQEDDENETTFKDIIREPITIYINSVGGSIEECFALLSAMDNSKTPIYTVVLGKAYSAGFLILISGDVRFAGRFSSAMYHQGTAGIFSSTNHIIEYAAYIKRINTIVEDLTVEKTLISKEQLEEIFEKGQDYYMDATEMLEYGVVDHLLQSK